MIPRAQRNYRLHHPSGQPASKTDPPAFFLMVNRHLPLNCATYLYNFRTCTISVHVSSWQREVKEDGRNRWSCLRRRRCQLGSRPYQQPAFSASSPLGSGATDYSRARMPIKGCLRMDVGGVRQSSAASSWLRGGGNLKDHELATESRT